LIDAGYSGRMDCLLLLRLYLRFFYALYIFVYVFANSIDRGINVEVLDLWRCGSRSLWATALAWYLSRGRAKGEGMQQFSEWFFCMYYNGI